jgi:hypothetical protein
LLLQIEPYGVSFLKGNRVPEASIPPLTGRSAKNQVAQASTCHPAGYKGAGLKLLPLNAWTAGVGAAGECTGFEVSPRARRPPEDHAGMTSQHLKNNTPVNTEVLWGGGGGMTVRGDLALWHSRLLTY